MTALARANEVYRGRVEVKRALRERETTLNHVLSEPSVQTAMIYDVLLWQRQWGRSRVLSVLVSLQISETRLVRELTDRQKGLIVEACRGERKVAA